MKDEHDKSDDFKKLKKKSESAEVKTNKDLFDNMIATQKKNMRYYNISDK